MNTMCIQVYEYNVHTSQVLWIQAYKGHFTNTVCIQVKFMNTVCIQCKFYEYSLPTCISFMNTVCILCKFYEYSVHTM